MDIKVKTKHLNDAAIAPQQDDIITPTMLKEHVVNSEAEATNKTGYKDSAMRNDILSLFPQEWRDIMKPGHGRGINH